MRRRRGTVAHTLRTPRAGCHATTSRMDDTTRPDEDAGGDAAATAGASPADPRCAGLAVRFVPYLVETCAEER